MSTKKSSKTTKYATKSTVAKASKPAIVDHDHVGKCFVALGLVISALLFGLFYFMGRSAARTCNCPTCSAPTSQEALEETQE